MNTTSQSLLMRIREPADSEAWSRFVHLYGPLIPKWGRRAGLSADDAAELAQDVFALLVRKLPEFRYDPSKSFRSWLKTVTVNRWREQCRRRSLPIAATSSSALVQLPEPAEDRQFWESEYETHVIRRTMGLLKSEFRSPTWEALQRYVFDGESPDQLAQEYGLSVWTIYAAKSRLIKKLRRELEGLLD